jgi:hypothetical protein
LNLPGSNLRRFSASHLALLTPWSRPRLSTTCVTAPVHESVIPLALSVFREGSRHAARDLLFVSSSGHGFSPCGSACTGFSLCAVGSHRLQPLRPCVAQASACVPCFRRGGVYPARRRGAPSVRFAGLSRLSLRHVTAFYPACPDAGREARRAAVPNPHYSHGASAPESATPRPLPRLSTNLSSRAAMRRGICFSFLAPPLNAAKHPKTTPCETPND